VGVRPDALVRDLSATALLFPGQGAQVVGMGRAWAEAVPEVAKFFERADAATRLPLARACAEGPPDLLNRTDVAQPALFTLGAAVARALASRGEIEPSRAAAAAGLSLGEYTALHVASVFSFEDGLRLVAERGRAMQAASEAKPSGMTSVLGLDLGAVEEACREASARGIVSVANRNGPGQIVIGGEIAALEEAERRCKEKGGRRLVRLAVAGAFHTECMRPAAEALRRALEATAISAPTVPVVSNVTATFHSTPADIREALARQVCCPVLWEDSMRAIRARGIASFLELPPGSVLRGLLRKIDPQASVRGADTPEEWAKEWAEK
jgi:[acyl-carrier-protein] S-malonyltransferase